MIVVDTNVMVYLLTADEEDRGASDRFREDPEWCAPPILLSELRNVLCGFVRRDWMSLADAVESYADASDILRTRVVNVDGNAVLHAAVDTGLTAYDAEFVVCARELGVQLVTTDEEILRCAPDVARTP